MRRNTYEVSFRHTYLGHPSRTRVVLIHEPSSIISSENPEFTGKSTLPGEDAEPVILATEEPVPRVVLDPISTQLKDPEVKDFGWNTPPDRVPAPLVKGLSNDDIYTLLRRFNKVPPPIISIHPSR